MTVKGQGYTNAGAKRAICLRNGPPEVIASPSLRRCCRNQSRQERIQFHQNVPKISIFPIRSFKRTNGV